MLSIQRLLRVAILLTLLQYNAVLSFTVSVASKDVAIGQTFGVSWTSASSDPEDVDICLSRGSDFIRVGSIQRSNSLKGTVDVTLNNTISPGTYTLGIRFTGCSFLLAEDFNDFVVQKQPEAVTTTTSTHTTTASLHNPTSSPTTSSTPRTLASSIARSTTSTPALTTTATAVQTVTQSSQSTPSSGGLTSTLTIPNSSSSSSSTSSSSANATITSTTSDGMPNAVVRSILGLMVVPLFLQVGFL